MYFFISRIYYIILGCVSFFIFTNIVNGSETNTIKNILKIKTYISTPYSPFVFTSYGSAIAISPSRILTNAHVILGSDGEPTGLYEVCFSTDYTQVPVCDESARLIAYDTVADLALLELSHTTSLVPFSLATSKLAIGSYVSMYGYPGIGGETITRTEGKIAGFEQTMYKIDGSIDHGNSGGGAFNNSGELVGMPTAVASDNASIGYMVPIKRIQEFLNKKTNNYEIYTKNINASFIKFLEKNQTYTKNTPIYKWNTINIRNPRRYGFTLKSSMVSKDNSMANWSFVDSYDRVHFSISCTDDAGGISGWQARLNGLGSEQKLYPTWDISFIDDKDFLTIFSSNKGYKSGVVIYYKLYDACYADIDYLDSRKDAKSLNKAIKFLKNEVTFPQKYILKDMHSNSFFTKEYIPKDTRIIRSIDTLGVESMLLGFEITPGNWLNAIIEGNQYSTLSELGNALGADFAEVKTWNQYITLGVKTGIDASKIHTLLLGPDQKGILYTSYDKEKKNTTIVFEYTYKTLDEQYAYWTWSATLIGDHEVDIDRIKNLFTGLKYPGKSFLKD